MQQVKISSWGNSLGFRIPPSLADSYNLQAGDVLELTPVDEGMLIKKLQVKPTDWPIFWILSPTQRLLHKWI